MPAFSRSPTQATLTLQTDAKYEAFLKLYVPVQLKLLKYIRIMVYDRADAGDLFQETSLVLWRRFPSFRQGGDFSNWAIGIARRQLLKYWRTRKKERLTFSESLLESLANDAGELVSESTSQQTAFEECLRRLTVRQHELIRLFYGEGCSYASIAARWNRSIHAVHKALKVMRRALLQCVESKLPEEC
ncbi:sigma-70 family RNA polymerase sigma factor [Planctomicrobium sp. SH664]|uniref:sigma-70 family RNA polymerase sigma factor n=1 Tax=Planctomicrobium sp. SH664 TaxID=3448125 RepID=UPI003F5B3EA3